MSKKQRIDYPLQHMRSALIVPLKSRWKRFERIIAPSRRLGRWLFFDVESFSLRIPIKRA